MRYLIMSAMLTLIVGCGDYRYDCHVANMLKKGGRYQCKEFDVSYNKFINQLDHNCAVGITGFRKGENICEYYTRWKNENKW